MRPSPSGSGLGFLHEIPDQIGILKTLQEQAKHDYISPYYIALIFAGLDDKERAFEWLEKAYSDRNEWLVTNRVDEKYFDMLGLTIEGRGFRTGETRSRAHVAIISRATASLLWPAAPAIGQSFRLEDGVYEVIGTVPDVVSGWLFEGKDRSAVYLPGAAGQERRGVGSIG